jgi:hypothetical protein
MEQNLAKRESEKQNIKAEIENTVRREWEVKARLEYIVSGGVVIGSVVLVLLHFNGNPFLHFRLKSLAECS